MEVYAGEKEQHGELCRPGEHVISWFKNEVERMSFDTQNAWRMSDINSKFRLCPSYPQQLLVPACITDKELENVAAFRSWKRFPAVVYRHISTGAVIARCGQPEVSWWGWRNADDEHLVQSIAKACAVNSSPHKHVQNSSYTNGSDLPDTEFESSMTNSTEVETLVIQPHKLLILDARSYAAAVANRAKGGGCECPEYYPNCEVVFMGMANIHSIRKSFQSLSFLCTQMPDPANWLSALESTKWLQHLSLLLKAALLVVNAVDRDHRPVLVHCSDGWDRTPQIVALSKLLLDPYYRTVEGFQVLVETDWLDFGHKFADRCGHGESSEDLNERCPVFLQWLDSVHQLQRQFPCSFEFNEAFLVKLVQHTYSCLFGTFLCNSGKEREDRHVQERTCSVWSLLRPANRTLRNMLYSSHSETVLHPVCHVRNLMLWSAVYLPSSSPTTLSDDSCAPYPVPGANPQDTPLARYTKTRSFDSLPSACELGQSMAPNRRSSDPNLNEKWQDHRRSLEINIAVGPDGEGNQDQEPLSNAELSVAVGVAEGQMQNILQEATKKEVAADQREDSVTAADVVTAVDKESGRDEKVGEEQESTKVNASEILTESVLNGHCPESDLTDGAKDKEAYILPPLVSERAEKPDNQTGHVTQTPEEVVTQAGENSSMEEEVTHGPSESDSPEHEQPAAHRTITNGFVDRPPEGLGQDQEEMCPDCEPDQGICEPVDKRVSVLESSTETLTEEACSRLEHAIQPPSLLSRPPCIDGRSRPPCSRRERAIDTSERSLGITLNGGTKRPPVGAFQSASIDLDRDGLCNGENSEGEPGGAPHWPAGNGQLSLASCNSLILHQWGSCSQHHWCHTMMSQAAMSPEQPSRNHLDDDGLTLHTDAIQQRLRQIEMQQNTGSQRINDSEYNLDPNCLSHCSTELFSVASREQVDKQNTEVTRWYPDHLAAQCYGCDSRFWLATRKHHCRNCGNVFCASCCDQKIPVPSQQLFEPSRVCKSCYGSLHLSSVPLDLEKPITACSN
uniref:phosphatidylinositol-3,5-bisphosphate 3-phosphatase n=1 Tax=Cynoglossus semilaevis TaxID=244447 RepID=A0A3P8VVZ7_CYNSE